MGEKNAIPPKDMKVVRRLTFNTNEIKNKFIKSVLPSTLQSMGKEEYEVRRMSHVWMKSYQKYNPVPQRL
ncbi:hypothetical protein CDAR_615871 [Caerostris darwini]|uniref:Uncharacterized protein n=1 Tax=Caerostris darwini TaxID=1538125 RepID=A0AAV4RY72_9ARAC|nr:hypothetical protein CDAR_615871 [Caerostris darwini]